MGRIDYVDDPGAPDANSVVPLPFARARANMTQHPALAPWKIPFGSRQVS